MDQSVCMYKTLSKGLITKVWNHKKRLFMTAHGLLCSYKINTSACNMYIMKYKFFTYNYYFRWQTDLDNGTTPTISKNSNKMKSPLKEVKKKNRTN